jgi:ribonuclease J
VLRSSSDHSLRLVPLGGLGEIGMNCLAIEQPDGILIVDCGSGFPHDDFGVDVLHPNFSWLLERAERVCGVFLTHGHEDHIGALPYLLAELDVPVWGPPHALALARRRLDDHDFERDEVTLFTTEPGKRYDVGPFEVEPVRVAHSIVEAMALAIRTYAGLVLHSGDFNFDDDPPDGEPTDAARLAALGDEGVELLLSDSTNIDVPERPGSERAVGETLERLIGAAAARAFVVMFASNVQRLMLLGQIAERAGRKICLLGRSLNSQVEIATRIGRLHWPSDLCVAPELARTWPRRELLVLAGGSQAEPRSAMARLAAGTHPELAVDPGDSVILSSRIIPGNDRAVFAMMSDLLRRGALVHTRVSDPGVHTSGHAGRSEQARMIELTRPRCFLPVHGTLHHMKRHAELAQGLGVGEVIVVENGTPVVLDAGRLTAETPFLAEPIAVAEGGEPLTVEARNRRAELGRAGLVAVSVLTDSRLRLIGEPRVTTRGVPAVDDDEAASAAIARAVARRLDRVRSWRGVDLEDELRRAARRAAQELSGSRPVVELHLLVAEPP